MLALFEDRSLQGLMYIKKILSDIYMKHRAARDLLLPRLIRGTSRYALDRNLPKI